MALTMYQASVPVFEQLLESLAAILNKAEAHCSESGKIPNELLELRLAPDMFTLKQQVQRACLHASGTAARLPSLDVPEETDDEASFDDLQARISRTRAFLATLTVAQMADSVTGTIEQQTRIGTLTFSGPDYLLHFALPHFMFHVTTAYNIIRHAGVEIGKVDFLGSAVR